MVRLSIFAGLALSATVLAAPAPAPAPVPIEFDPSGEKNVGNGAGLQFVGGACLSSADCANGNVDKCCAFVTGVSDRGICSSDNEGVSRANGKAGCGFGDGGAAVAAPEVVEPSPAAEAPPAEVVVDNGNAADCAAVEQSGSQNVGKGDGSQFITGQCLSKADCASGCCVAQDSGIALCKAQVLTEMQGLSCDFVCGAGNAPPVNNAAVVEGDAAINEAPAAQNKIAAAACAIAEGAAGVQNVNTGAGTQFITGQCFSPADCASGCCVEQGSGIAVCKARLVTEQAGGSCGFSCSDLNAVIPL